MGRRFCLLCYEVCPFGFSRTPFSVVLTIASRVRFRMKLVFYVLFHPVVRGPRGKPVVRPFFAPIQQRLGTRDHHCARVEPITYPIQCTTTHPHSAVTLRSLSSIRVFHHQLMVAHLLEPPRLQPLLVLLQTLFLQTRTERFHFNLGSPLLVRLFQSSLRRLPFAVGRLRNCPFHRTRRGRHLVCTRRTGFRLTFHCRFRRTLLLHTLILTTSAEYILAIGILDGSRLSLSFSSSSTTATVALLRQPQPTIALSTKTRQQPAHALSLALTEKRLHIRLLHDPPIPSLHPRALLILLPQKTNHTPPRRHCALHLLPNALIPVPLRPIQQIKTRHAPGRKPDLHPPKHRQPLRCPLHKMIQIDRLPAHPPPPHRLHRRSKAHPLTPPPLPAIMHRPAPPNREENPHPAPIARSQLPGAQPRIKPAKPFLAQPNFPDAGLAHAGLPRCALYNRHLALGDGFDAVEADFEVRDDVVAEGGRVGEGWGGGGEGEGQDGVREEGRVVADGVGEGSRHVGRGRGEGEGRVGAAVAEIKGSG
ncbi:MAG: hypothetical protein FRX48_07907 [Lasallia pustulata]|uniref:Uncharacterized protein n=1 Tax=Lasallia pustulata TaxID=136370 RepID=A0A5M8PFY4_9LECA|nr:MAG: hypothetical protein FRX48_07907 [Lasallia pustulata]